MSELPPEIDTSRPHSARMYDYFIGGKNHFAADRQTASEVLRNSPHVQIAARENRAFLGRAVRYLATDVNEGGAGIRQFLDIGTGLPTMNNVHDVAQDVTPSARVVYVDNDPLVLTHARALLTSAPEGRTAYIQADLRDPAAILADPATRDVLDFGEPIALMLVAILHFAPDNSAGGGHRHPARRAAVGQLPRRDAPGDGSRRGVHVRGTAGDARGGHPDAEAGLRRIRQAGVLRARTGAARRGARLRMAARRHRAAPGAVRGELLRGRRAQAVTPR